MNKTIILLITCVPAIITSYAQRADSTQSNLVRKSLLSIQTGFLGIWIHNEWEFGHQTALRGELGICGIPYGLGPSEEPHVWAPIATIEPRWYYNLVKRMNNLKDITDNSGDFISLKMSYSYYYWTNEYFKKLKKVNAFFISCVWGIRRNIGTDFNFEIGMRAGLQYYIFPDGRIQDLFSVYPHLRVGYRFQKTHPAK